MGVTDHIRVGAIWRERDTGRLVRILAECAYGTGPAWTYCDAAGNAEPHGHEPANGHTYPDWYWHYCDVLDFVLWGRFVPLGPAADGQPPAGVSPVGTPSAPAPRQDSRGSDDVALIRLTVSHTNSEATKNDRGGGD